MEQYYHVLVWQVLKEQLLYPPHIKKVHSINQNENNVLAIVLVTDEPDFSRDKILSDPMKIFGLMKSQKQFVSATIKWISL